jgi:hypothetical protein
MDSPLAFLMRYRQLRVRYADPARSTAAAPVTEEVTVSLRRYLSAVDDPCNNKKKFATEEAQKACETDPKMAEKRQDFLDFRDNHLRPKDRVLPDGAGHGEARLAVNRAFNGKGSPEDCETALQWAVEKGECSPGHANVQQYCDDHLGLDCNGFVDRFFRRGESHLPSEYTAGKTPTIRNSLDEVTTGDCLLWCDKTGKVFAFPPDRHIAIVERTVITASLRPKHIDSYESSYDISRLSIGHRIHVVESTGGLGPSESYYAIRAVKTDKKGRSIFQVFRPRKGSLSWVRIVPGLVLEVRAVRKWAPGFFKDMKKSIDNVLAK